MIKTTYLYMMSTYPRYGHNVDAHVHSLEGIFNVIAVRRVVLKSGLQPALSCMEQRAPALHRLRSRIQVPPNIDDPWVGSENGHSRAYCTTCLLKSPAGYWYCCALLSLQTCACGTLAFSHLQVFWDPGHLWLSPRTNYTYQGECELDAHNAAIYELDNLFYLDLCLHDTDNETVVNIN